MIIPNLLFFKRPAADPDASDDFPPDPPSWEPRPPRRAAPDFMNWLVYLMLALFAGIVAGFTTLFSGGGVGATLLVAGVCAGGTLAFLAWRKPFTLEAWPP